MSGMNNAFIEVLEANPELMADYDRACAANDDQLLEVVFEKAQEILFGPRKAHRHETA